MGRRGGGTCIYYKSSLPIRPCPELSLNGLEAVWISIKGGQGQHAVACVYRAPDVRIDYWNDLKESLQRAHAQAPHMTIIGDLNVYMITHSHHRTHLQDLSNMFGISNLVKSPTRPTPSGNHGSVIDLVLADHNFVSSCAVMEFWISDHHAVMANLHIAIATTSPGRQRQKRRHLRNIDLHQFRCDLAEALNANPTSAHMDVDDMWTAFYEGFKTVLDIHAPIMLLSRCQRAAARLPWLDKVTYQLTQKKNRLHKRWLGDRGNDILLSQYKTARSQASNAIRRKRNAFFTRQCEQHSHDPRRMWSTLNAVTGRSKARQDPMFDVSAVSSSFNSIVTDQSSGHPTDTPWSLHPHLTISSHANDLS